MMGDDAFDPLIWKRATELFEASLRRDRAVDRRARPAPSIALLDPPARARLIARARDELSRDAPLGEAVGFLDGAAQTTAPIRLFRRRQGHRRSAAGRE